MKCNIWHLEDDRHMRTLMGQHSNNFIISILFMLLIVHMQLDVNECLTGNGGCTHNCNNTVGSYQCYCEDGYKLNSDDHTCDGKTSPYNS